MGQCWRTSQLRYVDGSRECLPQFRLNDHSRSSRCTSVHSVKHVVNKELENHSRASRCSSVHSVKHVVNEQLEDHSRAPRCGSVHSDKHIVNEDHSCDAHVILPFPMIPLYSFVLFALSLQAV